MKSRASSIVKRKAEAALCVAKKLRSMRPRQSRFQISPVVRSSFLKDEGVSARFDDSSSGPLSDGDSVSCGSSRVSKSSNARIRQLSEGKDFGARTKLKERINDPTFRRITRSYYKQQEIERKKNQVEGSESSCVESNYGADSMFNSLKVKKGDDNVKGYEKNENDAVSVTQSDLTCVHQASDARNSKFSTENKENDNVSVTNRLEFHSDSKFGTVTKGTDNEGSPEFDLSEISKPNSVAEAYLTLLTSETVAQQQLPKLEIVGCHSDLACSEVFSSDDVSDNKISELQSQILQENLGFDSSDYTPSTYFDSGSEFSEKSFDSSSISETYSLFLEFKEQFSESTVPDAVKSSNLEEQYEIQSTLLRFEDDEEDESYQMFRERERRQVYLGDYAEEYCAMTEHGDLVLHERLQMVQWIVEQCTAKELQQETMFLGVSLLDRCLRRGLFKCKRNLQITGIACLALATRMEENQPYNSVRQRNFYILNNKYSRREVVAMEWLVQEVLNFRCFLPTVYNFLWFYLKAAEADAQLEKKAKYFAMLSLSDHSQLCYWPSTVAAALVILASIYTNKFTARKQVIQLHVRIKDNDLAECVKSLEWLLSV